MFYNLLGQKIGRMKVVVIEKCDDGKNVLMYFSFWYITDNDDYDQQGRETTNDGYSIHFLWKKDISDQTSEIFFETLDHNPELFCIVD